MKLFAVAGLALSLALGGCTSALQTAGGVGQSISMASPTQARTLAEALQAATVATRVVDVYVQTANPSRDVLLELQMLNEQVHTSLMNLQIANARGQSLTFAAFNEALSAFQSYSNAKGIK